MRLCGSLSLEQERSVDSVQATISWIFLYNMLKFYPLSIEKQHKMIDRNERILNPNLQFLWLIYFLCAR